MVRRTTLVQLVHLLQEDYLKIRGKSKFFLYFLQTLLDTSREIQVQVLMCSIISFDKLNIFKFIKYYLDPVRVLYGAEIVEKNSQYYVFKFYRGCISLQ